MQTLGEFERELAIRIRLHGVRFPFLEGETCLITSVFMGKVCCATQHLSIYALHPQVGYEYEETT